MSLRALIGFALGALLALILAPSALGVTIANGDIIVNNTLNGQVLRVDPATGTTTPIVTISSFPIQGIAVEADGKILVCGRGTGGGPGDFAKVIRIDPVTGTTSVLASGDLLAQPLDVDVAPDGQIYAVDTVTAGKVIRIDPVSGAQTLIAATPPAQALGTLSAPRGIAVADNGALLVANRNTLDPGVLRFSPTPGAMPTTVASGEPPFELPHGIAVEDGGDIVVADPFVAPLTPGAQTGALIRVDPSTGNTDTFMNGFAPLGIAVEDAGTLAMVSAGNAGVWRVNPSSGARTSLTPGITPTAIEVAEVNRPPVATADLYAVEADGTLTIPADGVLANDSDPDGDTLTTGLVDGPASGVLDLDADGGFTYTPPAGFLGDVMFTYGASDGRATSGPATVTLEVRDTIAPMVTINQAAGQADPTSQSPILFDVLFSEAVSGFEASDVVLTGSATSVQASVTGSGAAYSVSVDVLAGDGQVVAGLAPGAALDRGGNPSTASTSADDSVTIDRTNGTLSLSLHPLQLSPVREGLGLLFLARFSEPPVDFGPEDVGAGFLTGAGDLRVSNVFPENAELFGPNAFRILVAVSYGEGTVSLEIPPGAVLDRVGYPFIRIPPDPFAAPQVIIDRTAPSVTIEQASGQADPTSQGPIEFTIGFNEPVFGLTAEDLVLGGSATGQVADLTGTGADYVVRVDPTSQGTVSASLPAGAASDLAGNPSAASTSTDNTVTFAPTPVAAASIADATPVVEGDTGTKTMRFTLTRTGSLAQAATVQWHTEDGTAIAGEDYEARLNRTVRFAAGAATATVSVPVVGDRIGEEDETLRVVLDSSTGAPIGDGEAVGTIVDNDPPSLTIADAAVAEGRSGTKSLKFAVRLSRRWNAPVTVQWRTEDLTATAGSDYAGASGTVTIEPGSRAPTAVSVPAVTINGDRVVEPDETLRVVLSAPSGAEIIDGEAIGTIRNDD